MPGRALAMVKALTSTRRRDASSRLGEWASRPARQPGRNPWDVVGEGGVEPPRPYGHTDLNRARLPFRHSPVDSDRGYHSGACPTGRRGDASSRIRSPRAGKGVGVGVLQRLERRLGGLVEGPFARAFKGNVEPV